MINTDREIDNLYSKNMLKGPNKYDYTTNALNLDNGSHDNLE